MTTRPSGPGRTQRTTDNTTPLPRTPDERDESADQQHPVPPDAGQPSQREIGTKAHEDLRSGRQDTGLQPVTDAVYRRQRRAERRRRR